ncbi:MAG: N-acetylmuramoyl-L-alanine amidase [Dorea sp.]|nr:N-acetylmuramoyl-L-alanine amidase [Dorea sp.]
MSNSALAVRTKISPNRNAPRNHKIDTITIHVYVGETNLESMLGWFAQSSAKCSCNYCIDKDGLIGLCVDEADRSWCSSSETNDNRAVTIECASGTKYPYRINDKVYASLIKLVADICKRNGIKKLLWKNDPALVGNVSMQNITLHRWFAAKECPGQYVIDHLPDIVKKVNAMLGVKEQSSDTEDVIIHGMKASDIARYVMAEFGIASGKNYDCLLGVAQCMKDMLEDGRFGSNLNEVLDNNFTLPDVHYTDECLEAVLDVFVKGKCRFPNAKILQFRSFKNYGDGNGNPDSVKCKILLMNYQYLGADSISQEYGHLYFGISNEPRYRVQVGAFSVRENAEKLLKELIEKGYKDAFIRE